jgi:chaperonin GroEL (HSP60 family)
MLQQFLHKDRAIGDLIAEAMDKVGKDGVITVEEASTALRSNSNSQKVCNSIRAISLHIS